MRRGMLLILLLCTVPLAAGVAWRQEKNAAFSDKEHLVFSVHWQFITVGSAVMDVRGIEEVRGRPCYHIVTEASTSSFFDAFYKVRDKNESFMDTQSLSSLRYVSHICEGKYCSQETIELFGDTGRYEIAVSTKCGPTSPWVQDVLSALYYLRTRQLEPERTYSIDAQSGDKTWPLTVKVLGRAKVHVPAGRFDCVVVEPKLREGAGIFKAQGKLTVWLTDDARHMPVLMRSKIAIGAIEAELTESEATNGSKTN